MALPDTRSWTSSRARAAALGRWWPALMVLALAWVAWLNAPGECSLEESSWREADAHLTRLMIRMHRTHSAAQSSAAQSSARSAPAGSVAPGLVEQRTFALHAAEPADELVRAKRELESSLGELRMCWQGGAARAQRERAAGPF